MLSNYYTLAMLAADIDAKLRGKVIREAYSQEKNELVVSFDGMPEAMIVSCAPDVNTLYLHPNFSRARTNSTNVLKAAHGKSIVSVSIQPMDRVIVFELQDGLTMYARFFGSRANVLLVHQGSDIIDAFKDARSAIGSHVVPHHGGKVHGIAALRNLIVQEPTQKLFILLKRASPTFGPTLASEVLFRCGVSATSHAYEMSDDHMTRLETSYKAVLTELAQPTPRVYVGKEPPCVPYRFSLVHLEHCRNLDEKFFTDIHEAIRFFVSRTRSTGTLQSLVGSIVATLGQHRTRLQRTVAAVEEDLKRTSRADEYDKYATLLMGNLGRVEKGMKSVGIPGDRETVVVPLDAKLSPVQNAQSYFEKAKKSRHACDQSRKRLAELHAAFLVIEELLRSAETTRTKEDLKKFLAERAVALEKFGIGEKAKEREHLPFRIFVVEGGFEVWAGKSSRNNDELTMKHARPNDLWFHARGSSGSHVLLKTNTGSGEPSKKAREQAAGIAAYYSKMKNARMVPVAMTERKYVRKPKGSPPGTVVLEREKVIFAEPALPEG